jgi:hypothetical protein
MLNHYIELISREMQKVAAESAFIDRLALLPPTELAQVRRTGEIKLAFCDEEWVQKFMGTPHAQRAIELAEEQLRMDAEESQLSLQRDADRRDRDLARENVRLEKRLLELELFKSQMPPTAGAMAQNTTPVAAPPAAAPEKVAFLDTLVAGALGAKKAREAEEDSFHGSLRGAGGYLGGQLLGGTAGAALGAGAGKLMHADPEMVAMMGARIGSIPGGILGYKAMTRKYNKKDEDADDDKYAFDTSALRGFGHQALDFAKSNPALVAGGVLGAAHGALREDGGLGSAVLEGAGGAALGAAGHAAYNKGQTWRAARRGAAASGPPAQLVAGAPNSVYPPEGRYMKVAFDKEAFGAMLAQGVSKALPAAMAWAKTNPLKAGLGAVSAASNFNQARQSGQGMGSSLLAGAGGAAGMAL